MDPVMAANRPSRCTRTGIRVWAGRFPPARLFGESGSSENPCPRLWQTTPVEGSRVPEPNPLGRRAVREHAHPAGSNLIAQRRDMALVEERAYGDPGVPGIGVVPVPVHGRGGEHFGKY